MRTSLVNHFEELNSGELHEEHAETIWSLDHFSPFAARGKNSVRASCEMAVLGL
jgi:hypothetical protein